MSDELLSALEIEELCRARGIGIRDLARRSGVAASTFMRWRAGQIEPSLRSYQKMRDVAVGTEPLNPPPPKPGRKVPRQDPQPMAIVDPGFSSLPAPRRRNRNT